MRCLSMSRECSEAGVPGAKPESVASEGNLAMTYSALASLAALGDDFADVDVEAILRALRSLQHQDGRYDVHKRLCFDETPHFCLSQMLKERSSLPSDNEANNHATRTIRL